MTRGMGKNLLALWIACLPGILSASCSSKTSLSSEDPPKLECVHGICSESNICDCNPCWSGLTCSEYVDRFAPRFLAEEPFFILDAGPWTSTPHHPPTERGVLFRLESSDDDLGLTCQLGQVGPAARPATCPCATPRYSVVGESGKMFYTDEETGDVFLRPGFTLQPNTHYLITLQVSTLKVNTSAYKAWRERVTATLYVRSEHNGFNGLENGLANLGIPQNKTSDSSSSSESVEFSDGFPLPELSLGRMTADSIFRYKRQIKRRTEVVLQHEEEGKSFWEEESFLPDLRISFPSQTLHGVGFGSGENIKLEASLQLPVMDVGNFESLSFQVQITTGGLETANGIYGLAICSANISFVGSAISYNSKSAIKNLTFKSTGSLPYPNTAVWNWRDVKISSMGRNELKRPRPNPNPTQINFTVSVLPFFLANRSSSVDPPGNTTAPAHSLRIDAKVRFLMEDEESDGGELDEESPIYKQKERQITTFLDLPIQHQTKSNEDGIKINTRKNSTNWIRVGLDGPLRIQRGAPNSFTIKVHLDERSRGTKTTNGIRVELRDIGNQTKSPIRIQRMELRRAGPSALSCCPLDILKGGFTVNCTSKTKGDDGSGDWCSISSPLLNICGEEGLSSRSEESNVLLEFSGIIYGLPDPSPDSQFVLQALVFVNGDPDDTITATAIFLGRTEHDSSSHKASPSPSHRLNH